MIAQLMPLLAIPDTNRSEKTPAFAEVFCSSGGGIRTRDLQVMSPTCARARRSGRRSRLAAQSTRTARADRTRARQKRLHISCARPRGLESLNFGPRGHRGLTPPLDWVPGHSTGVTAWPPRERCTTDPENQSSSKSSQVTNASSSIVLIHGPLGSAHPTPLARTLDGATFGATNASPDASRSSTAKDEMPANEHAPQIGDGRDKVEGLSCVNGVGVRVSLGALEKPRKASVRRSRCAGMTSTLAAGLSGSTARPSAPPGLGRARRAVP
jgi:hypothetical protein